MANCPICPQASLVHTQITTGLAGLGCTDCEGMLVGLVNYRAWRESRDLTLITPTTTGGAPEHQNTRAACLCPKCGAVMTKYHFSVDSDAQLDFCYHCEEIWFDEGEWALLAELSLEDELTQIFTHPWQHALLEKKISRSETIRWQETLGEDYQKIEETTKWLKTHPKKNQLVAYLFDSLRRK